VPSTMAAPFIPMRGIVSNPMGVPTLGSGVVGATLGAEAGAVVVGLVVPGEDGIEDEDVVVVAPSLCWSSWRSWSWAWCS